jgi:hypothetical protein
VSRSCLIQHIYTSTSRHFTNTSGVGSEICAACRPRRTCHYLFGVNSADPIRADLRLRPWPVRTDWYVPPTSCWYRR